MNLDPSTELASRLGWAVIHSLWQGALVAAMLATALALLRQRSAAARHTACLLALAVMLGGFGFTLTRSGTQPARVALQAPVPALPQLRAEVEHGTVQDQWDELRAEGRTPESNPEPRELRAAAAATQPTVKAWAEQLAGYAPRVGAVWLTGIALLLLWRIGGSWRVRSLRRNGVAAPSAEAQRVLAQLADRLGVRRAVQLLESSRAAVPMLTGFLRPVILLPARLASGLSSRELEALLAHELAHFARGDVWTNLLVLCAETIFFYQPGAWWIARRARREREHAADDLALRICEGRGAYATALARLAGLDSPPAPALAASGASLLERIRRILGQPARAESSAGLWAGAGALLSAALILSQILSAHAADEGIIIAVAPGESIQRAIDRAPAGALIRLGEGEWKERIVINKPLTLEGAGWEKTIIKPDQLPSGATPEAQAALLKGYGSGLRPEELAKLNREYVENFAPPTLLVRDTEDVSIRKLRIGGMPPEAPERAGGVLVSFHHAARAAMSDCAVVGPFGDGIQIAAESNVEIRRSLIAAFLGTGIFVEGTSGSRPSGSESPGFSRMRLLESDVRKAGVYGVEFGSGDGSVIERCRISGAGTGVFYNSDSPTITGSAVFGNGSGIKAAGQSRAIVRGNLFWNNRENGMGCWFNNFDDVEGNTFAGNGEAALLVMGPSGPKVTRNIFSNSPIAISCGTVGRMGGAPKLMANLFWETPVALQSFRPSGALPVPKDAVPKGMVKADPQFRDAAKNDFALVPSSSARAANIGVAEPLPLASPWPLLAEEKAIATNLEKRDSRSSDANSTKPVKQVDELVREARDATKTWLADAFQLDDAAKREAAIERIRAAMTSGNADEARPGVTAFVQLGSIEFDKASFRQAVRALLGSTDVPTRAAAASAFTMTGTEPEDVERILALADDPAPEVRENLSWIISGLHNRDLTGRAGEAVLKLLAREERHQLREALRGMWGAKFSPAVEARVVELSQNLESTDSPAYDAMYFALSTQANKSEASVKRLTELLAHRDTTNIAGRCAWGLQQGVDRAEFPFIANAMMKVLEARSEGSLRNDALSCLRTYGDAAQAPALKALLAKPGVTGEYRKLLEETLASLEKRPTEQTQKLASGAVEATRPQPAAPAPEKAEIEVEWRGKWWPARVLEKSGDQTLIHYVGFGSEWDERVSAERIRPLKSAAAVPETTAEARVAGLVQTNRQAARLRAADDRRNYTPEQLQEIETLYQVANTKGKRSPEAIASLKQLLEKYDKANRTGCATLYLGQASEGAERLEYLTRAVEKFSDCYYFNGCQVGGYGRYVLALTLWEKGEKDKARSLLAELKTTYKDATDHRGRPMSEAAEAAEKQLGAQP